MAEQPQHTPSPVPSAIQRIRFAVHRLSNRLAALAFVGAGAAFGIDSFGVLVSLWPVYPAPIAAVIVVIGIGYWLTRALDARRDRASGVTWRPPRGWSRHLR
mgnify:CR=1 FL=1